MPFLVRVTEGDNPREIAENVDDVTAHDMARNISAATGETVELVPYEYDHAAGAWVLAEHATTTIAAVTADEPAAVTVDETDDDALDLKALKGDELDQLAAEKSVEGYKKSATVAERRSFLSRFLHGGNA